MLKHSTKPDKVMIPQLFTLKNNLQVILIDTKTFPTLTTLLLVGAGSRYENEKNNGIAHFLEHMFYKGSKKYPNPKIISEIIEGMGGQWNAFTSKDYTGYYIKAATDHFPKIVDILSDILLNPLFDEKEIEKEKGVIVEEINMYEDTPQRRISEIFEGLMFKGNPLGFDIAGTKETVNKFNRDTFINYLDSLYQPQNAVLIVAGGLGEIEKIKNEINKTFGNWPNVKITGGFKKMILDQKNLNSLVHVKKTEQAHFCLGFPTFSINDERRHILSVLTTIMGGGASSKLFQEVREKRGLCYYISTGLEYYREIGNIVTQAGVTKEVNKAKEAVKATIKEHITMVKGEISNEDMDRAKEMLKGRLLLSMEDSFNIAHFFGNNKLLKNRIETPEQIISKISSVTKRQVVDLAKALFTVDKLNFAIIGPFQNEDFKDVLDF